GAAHRHGPRHGRGAGAAALVPGRDGRGRGAGARGGGLSAHGVLREVFGLEAFRPGQEAAVRALLDGRDAQVLLPTGGGKSLCYQVPAVLASRAGRGPTLVVSPLIALMEDQVGALRRLGVAAELLHSALPTAERRDVLARARRAAVLYVSPERAALAGFQRWLARADVPFVAVDEA